MAAKRNGTSHQSGPSTKKWDFRSIGNNFAEEMETFKLMDYRSTICEKFGFTKNIAEFTINPDVGRPDEAMQDAIDTMIQVAFKTTVERMKRKVRMFGVAITGAGLGFPVWVPYRAYPQNNAEVIMQEINKLGQSGDGDENKKMLLLSEPITMKITCVTMPSGEGPRNVHKFDLGFKEHQRIMISNGDKFCLFYALALSMNYLVMDKYSFYEECCAPEGGGI